eukprot:108347-Chlamydomonas_euryale.AAC.7
MPWAKRASSAPHMVVTQHHHLHRKNKSAVVGQPISIDAWTNMGICDNNRSVQACTHTKYPSAVASQITLCA